MSWNIFIDGASRNNPGPSGAGIYITHNSETIWKKGYDLGLKTNNQAEYLALLLALFLTEHELKSDRTPHPHLIITSDSELLVRQMKGRYRVRNKELAKIKQIIDRLLKDKSYTIKHVVREKNKIADKLANKGIDTKHQPPPAFLALLANHDIPL